MSNSLDRGSKVSADPPSPTVPTTNAISDEELWQLIGWRPASLYDLGCILFPQSPNVWGMQSGVTGNSPIRECIDWAKGEILRADKDWLLYVCRLLRVIKFFRRNEASLTVGVEWNFLCTVVAGGLVVAGKAKPWNGTCDVETTLKLAAMQHLIHIENIDEWHPGLASGSGWRRYVRLTLAGQRYVESQDSTPPPFDNRPPKPASSPADKKMVSPQQTEATQSPPPICVTSASASATDVSQPLYYSNKDRDAWIYEECVKGSPYKSIIRQLKNKSKTDDLEPIESIPGIRRAAERYADAHGLPRPPKRQHGRPPAEKN